MNSTVKDSSVVAVQIFDQRKFKRKQDQGFLGVINLKISDVLDLELGGQGKSSLLATRAACGVFQMCWPCIVVLHAQQRVILAKL